MQKGNKLELEKNRMNLQKDGKKTKWSVGNWIIMICVFSIVIGIGYGVASLVGGVMEDRKQEQIAQEKAEKELKVKEEIKQKKVEWINKHPWATPYGNAEGFDSTKVKWYDLAEETAKQKGVSMEEYAESIKDVKHETLEEKVAREKALFKKDWVNAKQHQNNKNEIDRINAELEKGKSWEEVKEELNK